MVTGQNAWASLQQEGLARYGLGAPGATAAEIGTVSALKNSIDAPRCLGLSIEISGERMTVEQFVAILITPAVLAGATAWLSSVLVAGFAAWLAARLALRRFRSEKAWERQAAAYTVIFGALHDMMNWCDQILDASSREAKLPDDRLQELHASFQEAEQELRKRVATDAWVLPSEAKDCLKGMLLAIRPETTDWTVYVTEREKAIAEAQETLERLVRRGLRIK